MASRSCCAGEVVFVFRLRHCTCTGLWCVCTQMQMFASSHKRSIGSFATWPSYRHAAFSSGVVGALMGNADSDRQFCTLIQIGNPAPTLAHLCTKFCMHSCTGSQTLLIDAIAVRPGFKVASCSDVSWRGGQVLKGALAAMLAGGSARI